MGVLSVRLGVIFFLRLWKVLERVESIGMCGKI